MARLETQVQPLLQTLQGLQNRVVQLEMYQEAHSDPPAPRPNTLLELASSID